MSEQDTTTGIKVGDRVRMDPEHTWLGISAPDLGVGTVVATKGEGLMEGWYVLVEWDEPSSADMPAIQALVKVQG